MARFEISSPDGERFEIEAPEGATEAQAFEFFKQQSNTTQQEPEQPPEPYESTGGYAKDLARIAGQGATLGFGDEITAGVRSVLPESLGGATYDEALEQERDAIDRFRHHNPATALGTEVAAGFAVPGVGLARAASGAASLGGRVARGAGVGAGFGAVGGFGVGEGGDGPLLSQAANRLSSAWTGLKYGAGLGATLPAVGAGLRAAGGATGSAMRRATQAIRDDEAAARQFLGDKLRASGQTEVDIARDLQRGQRARQFRQNSVVDLPETIADTSPVTQRLLRGIKVGGDADDIVVPALSERQAGNIDFARNAGSQGQFRRVFDDLRAAFNVTRRPLRDDIARISSTRRLRASDNFRRAERESETFNLTPVLTRYSAEALELPDPNQRRVLIDMIRLFDQAPFLPPGSRPAGVSGSRARQVSRRFGVDTVATFQKAKEALDAKLGTQAIREQGNLNRLLTTLKHDLMDVVAGGDRANPTRNPTYFDALQDFATRSELINAADLGRAIASGGEVVTTASWNGFNRAQQGIIRKSYLESLRSRVGGKAQGPSTDYTDVLRRPSVQENLRIMLPPRAGRAADFPGGSRERLTELARREVRGTSTNRIVLGNSTTAEKASDAMDIGRMARSARYIRDNGGPVPALISAVSEQLEKLGALKGRRARYLARKLLTTDPREQAEFLMQVRRTHGAQRAARIQQAVDNVAARIQTPAIAAGSRFAAQPE